MADEIRTTKEIGRLPISVNEDFAARQKALEEAKSLLQKTPNVQVDVVKPASSEVDLLLHSQRAYQPNAAFEAPTGFDTQYRRTFTHIPVPSLGNPDRLEVLIQRVSQIPEHENLGGKAIIRCLKATQEIGRMAVEIYSSIGNNKKG